ncbi:head GIN domain-containing protein [Cellulophaga sp. Z1A5H]|uniref:head GIN domain-containing protein n=1 Tax=Cellulophaga sp. Z1A5H TaxID=2687291 RepID=UPI0013FDCE07|nr:head GIN domain-containing protein [Cellulophaga sp. Z1A5H]
MTTLVRIAITLALSVFLTSCGMDIKIGEFGSGVKGNGIVTKDSRPVNEDFTVISASEGLEVIVTQAAIFEITVEADENIIALIGTDINNNVLKIHAIENIGNATKKVYVSLPNISEIKSASGANLTAKNTIKSERLTIDSSSGSLVNLKVVTDNLDIDASSGANIKIIGETGNATIDASSGSNVSANELATKFCDAEASSGANVAINVSKTLHADASSGGNISYSGKAQVDTKKNVSGSVTFNN